MRKKPRRKLRKPRPKKGTKAWDVWRKKVDERNKLRDWSKKIRKDGICEICGSEENLQAHHVLSKEHYPQFKYELMNGVCLCARCHKWSKLSAHKNAVFFIEWLKNNKKIQYDWAVKHV